MDGLNLITPVILCGGSGTRLWPRSRASLPKPFLPLIGETSLFEATLDRCAGPMFAAPMVVTGAAQLPHVDRLCGQRDCAIIVEPIARNTAPAIALAASRLAPEAVMLVCPSDHHIGDPEAFATAARIAAGLARGGQLVAFGISPDSPETGFGYIRAGDGIALPQESESADTAYAAFEIDQFVEKPDLERARRFLAEGTYFWNGGIFCFTAGRYLEELAAHRPDIAEDVKRAVALGHGEGAHFHPERQAFAAIRGESIDYAVMERTGRAAMVPVSMDWSDIGNWPSLHEARAGESDEHGNVARGPSELVDCRNVMVETDGPRVSVLGLSDVVVVVDGDEVMITTRDSAQKVGKLAGAMDQ